MISDASRILVTGGAGFIGSSLSLLFRRDHPDAKVIVLDNLIRPGSKLNVPRLEAGGVSFIHGDVRKVEDLEAVGPVDLLIECSAQPSVHAGYNDDPRYLIDTNLVGAINCIDHLRQTGGRLIFLSSSRVYPIQQLRQLPLELRGNRFEIEAGAQGEGWSSEGISETFPLGGTRSLYGATKLSAELVIAEYEAMYGVPSIVNRCGVIAGPWQMGKVDQGFVALWVARHVYGQSLKYMGFGGMGYQVRDILHVNDLYDLLVRQLELGEQCSGKIYNVGGGRETSTSLAELTQICRRETGAVINIAKDQETREADIPYFISDVTKTKQDIGWQPSTSVEEIIADIHKWIIDNKTALAPIFSA